MNKVPRLYATHCTECKGTIIFSPVKMQQPEFCLCYTCMGDYARMADFLRGDYKDHAQIELRRLSKPVTKYQLNGQFTTGLQTFAVLAQTLKRNKRMNKRDADSCDKPVSIKINNLTIS